VVRALCFLRFRQRAAGLPERQQVTFRIRHGREVAQLARDLTGQLTSCASALTGPQGGRCAVNEVIVDLVSARAAAAALEDQNEPELAQLAPCGLHRAFTEAGIVRQALGRRVALSSVTVSP
jgi:hypothetical protein